VLRNVIDGLAIIGRSRSIVVVPGGGALADEIRRLQQELGVSESAAHWMALLAMDQMAELLADQLPQGRLVEDTGGITDALAEGCIPVLAPARWMRAADMLPHSWDVTSDSISAFIAGALDAVELVLVKRQAGAWQDLTDRAMPDIMPSNLKIRVVTPDRLEFLD
jgi:aspartokinase-like uncharacterized kinase